MEIEFYFPLNFTTHSNQEADHPKQCTKKFHVSFLLYFTLSTSYSIIYRPLQVQKRH